MPVENRTKSIVARLKPKERLLIDQAADLAEVRLSDFIRAACMDRAREVLATRVGTQRRQAA